MKADVIEKLKKSLYLGKQQIGHVYSGHPTSKQVESHLRTALEYLTEVDKLIAELSEQEAEPDDYRICDYCKFETYPFTNQPCAECSNNFTNKWQPNSDNPKEPLKPTCQTCGGSGVVVVPVSMSVNVGETEPCPDCQKPETGWSAKSVISQKMFEEAQKPCSTDDCNGAYECTKDKTECEKLKTYGEYNPLDNPSLQVIGIDKAKKDTLDWCKHFNIDFYKDVADPDGWNRMDLDASTHEYITLDEFRDRLMRSTVMLSDKLKIAMGDKPPEPQNDDFNLEAFESFVYKSDDLRDEYVVLLNDALRHIKQQQKEIATKEQQIQELLHYKTTAYDELYIDFVNRGQEIERLREALKPLYEHCKNNMQICGIVYQAKQALEAK